MNRRSFFRAVASVAAGIAIAPKAIAAGWTDFQQSHGFITFKGVPLVFDPRCDSNRIYTVGPITGEFIYHLNAERGPMVAPADPWVSFPELIERYRKNG